MSYILNALKKAERERNRGGVPDIHTRQQFNEPLTTPLPLFWKAAILALILSALLTTTAIGWMFFTSPQNAEHVQSQAAQGVAGIPTPAVTPDYAPPLPVANEIPIVTNMLEPSVIPEIATLPEEIRRQIPKIVLSGHVYSKKDPARRRVIVNDQLVSQNEYIVDGLLVKQITPTGVVFVFNGQFFSMRANEIYR